MTGQYLPQYYHWQKLKPWVFLQFSAGISDSHPNSTRKLDETSRGFLGEEVLQYWNWACDVGPTKEYPKKTGSQSKSQFSQGSFAKALSSEETANFIQDDLVCHWVSLHWAPLLWFPAGHQVGGGISKDTCIIVVITKRKLQAALINFESPKVSLRCKSNVWKFETCYITYI